MDAPVIDDPELDPLEEALLPLAASVGRMVLGVAALEKVLLVDIAMRMFHDRPIAEELAAELTYLERRSGAPRSQAVSALGMKQRRRVRRVHSLLRSLAMTRAIVLSRGSGRKRARVSPKHPSRVVAK
jgi:hypothetical protein